MLVASLALLQNKAVSQIFSLFAPVGSVIAQNPTQLGKPGAARCTCIRGMK